MLSKRINKYYSFLIDYTAKDEIKRWKIESRKETKNLPNNFYNKLLQVVQEWFLCFDCMTVPAPSFHTYENYPIWEVAKKISGDTGIKLVKLFPENSGKEKMNTFGSLSKKVQDIKCEQNEFIFILDDIFTTGFTMRVSCEAIIRRNSFPCGLTIA